MEDEEANLAVYLARRGHTEPMLYKHLTNFLIQAFGYANPVHIQGYIYWTKYIDLLVAQFGPDVVIFLPKRAATVFKKFKDVSMQDEDDGQVLI